jgi:PIN like domain
VSHPDELPDLFIDRSLGRIKVPALLRAEGLRLITLAEHYGIPADEEVADEDWLELCGERGWLALMKDDRIRYLSVERRALVENWVRAAVITNANLSAEEMARRIIRAVPDLSLVCAERSGPFLFALQATRIEEIELGP